MEPFAPTNEEIKEISLKYYGCIAKIARHFSVHRSTVYKYFKRNPEGKEIVETVRDYTAETDLDLAEFVLRNNMKNYAKNPGLAQRAAEKILDKKGHLRGYGNQENNQNKISIADLCLLAQNGSLSQNN